MANTKIPSELSSTPSISDSGNATAITITSDEYVGIGNANPNSFRLYVDSSSTGKGLFVDAQDGGYTAIGFSGDGTTAKGSLTTHNGFIYVGSENTAGTGSNGEFRIEPSTSERLVISSTGHIGINDSSPSANSSSLVTLNIGGGIMTKNTANASTNYVFESRYSGSNNLTLGYKGNGSTHTASLIGSQNNLPLSIEVGGSERFKIDSDGNITTPNNPAFMAKLGGGTLYSQNYITFGTTYMNVGSHYNTSNGRFTAPIAGTYLFHWSAIGNSGAGVYRYYIYKNGASIGDSQLRHDTAEGEYGDNGSRIQMLSLSANDYVQIWYKSDASTVSYTSGDYVNFGGYLIG